MGMELNISKYLEIFHIGNTGIQSVQYEYSTVCMWRRYPVLRVKLITITITTTTTTMMMMMMIMYYYYYLYYYYYYVCSLTKLCQQFDETIDPITSACPILAKEQYVERHDKVSAQIHFNICKEIGVQLDKNHWYEHVSKWVVTNQGGKVTILWNQQVQTDRTTPVTSQTL
jgi:hypothetical protein